MKRILLSIILIVYSFHLYSFHAVLNITVYPEDAEIYADNVLMGKGQATIRLGYAKIINVRIIKLGFITQNLKFKYDTKQPEFISYKRRVNEFRFNLDEDPNSSNKSNEESNNNYSYKSVIVNDTLYSKEYDIITTRMGDELPSKVLKVNSDIIEYKRAINLNGPIYSIKKSEVLFIKYSNGTKEIFKQDEENE